MSKPKITEAACFEEVAKVIGRKNAERELFVVSQSLHFNFTGSCGLLGAFSWEDSAHGYNFWCLIRCGVNPYEQQTIMA